MCFVCLLPLTFPLGMTFCLHHHTPVYDYIAVGVSPDRELHIPADMGNPSLYSEICYNDTCLEAGRWATL
jgi:hypothetical protein